ncbi:MAG TPA: AI-2E family transporter [Candidatus Thalassarchaeaceae archaeon]|nr:AI-2E family transporter [Candidatus Thalassarchaeaceae archaeon]HJM19957.1 AI-2E family transporter [Candidatus Thalassarchaeaceae archaeon]HJM86816.1 AI-2E family transporter [Candidatus Thalassarchaeaceae archaeon]
MSKVDRFYGMKLSTAANVAILLLVSVLALIHLKTIIQPFIVAILLFFLINPSAKWLEDRYGHPLLAYGILVAITIGFISLAAILLYANLQSFSDKVPELAEQFNEKVTWLEGITIFGHSIELTSVVDNIGIDSIEAYSKGFLGTITSFSGSVATTLIFLIFIVLEAESLPGRLEAAYPRQVSRLQKIADGSGKSVSTYVLTRASVAFGQSVFVAVILFFFGIPGWFLWASIAFLLDFVPYIGGLIATLPPIILGFVLFEPTTLALLVLLLVVNQQTWGGFIEPQLSGERLDMSPIALLLLVAFWGWVWGLMGMVLGVPLGVIMKLALDNDEKTKPIAIMLSKNPPAEEE